MIANVVVPAQAGTYAVFNVVVPAQAGILRFPVKRGMTRSGSEA